MHGPLSFKLVPTPLGQTSANFVVCLTAGAQICLICHTASSGTPSSVSAGSSWPTGPHYCVSISGLQRFCGPSWMVRDSNGHHLCCLCMPCKIRTQSRHLHWWHAVLAALNDSCASLTLVHIRAPQAYSWQEEGSRESAAHRSAGSPLHLRQKLPNMLFIDIFLTNLPRQ